MFIHGAEYNSCSPSFPLLLLQAIALIQVLAVSLLARGTADQILFSASLKNPDGGERAYQLLGNTSSRMITKVKHL